MNRSLIFAVVIALAVAGCGEGYSSGTRAGVVTKLSHKGIFCKSWEGELALQSFRRVSDSDGKSAMTNAFAFTVEDPAVVHQLQAALEVGKPVVLTYDEWMIAGPCRADTSYFITSVKAEG